VDRCRGRRQEETESAVFPGNVGSSAEVKYNATRKKAAAHGNKDGGGNKGWPRALQCLKRGQRGFESEVDPCLIALRVEVHWARHLYVGFKDVEPGPKLKFKKLKSVPLFQIICGHGESPDGEEPSYFPQRNSKQDRHGPLLHGTTGRRGLRKKPADGGKDIALHVGNYEGLGKSFELGFRVGGEKRL